LTRKPVICKASCIFSKVQRPNQSASESYQQELQTVHGKIYQYYYVANTSRIPC